MEVNYKRSLIKNKYHALEVHNISIELIVFAARLGFNCVTVENFSHYYFPKITNLTLENGNQLINPKLKQFTFDLEISKNEFLSLKEVWNKQGCFAIFHNKPIKFKVTDLDSAARYKALDNFDWNLELAVPSGASDGCGQITSPDKLIIDELEQKIISINKN
jgi:hypothetical protein